MLLVKGYCQGIRLDVLVHISLERGRREGEGKMCLCMCSFICSCLSSLIESLVAYPMVFPRCRKSACACTCFAGTHCACHLKRHPTLQQLHHHHHHQSTTFNTSNPTPSAPSPSSPPPPTPPSSSPPPSSSSPTPPPSSPPPPHHLDWLRTRVRACEEGKEVWWSDRFG